MKNRKFILASHGDFSKGLKSSLQMIAGEAADAICTYSLYPGENAIDFKEELEQEIRAFTDTEFVILTDVFGGSVCNSLFPLSVYENVRLFSGMNFSMAIEVLTGYPDGLGEAEIQELLNTAKDGVCHVILQEEEKEDF